MTELPEGVAPDLDELDERDVDLVETEVVAIEAVDTRVLDVDDLEDDERDPRDIETAAYGDGALFAVAPAGGVAALATLPEPEVTGDARVDAATARLGELVDLPASDHVGVYEDVHRRLQDALADAEVT